jgi:DNA-directed RNA polymerase subunit K/omega
MGTGQHPGKQLARGSTVILITPETNEQILTITMELIHRGLIPVIILIDPSGFGGTQDS